MPGKGKAPGSLPCLPESDSRLEASPLLRGSPFAQIALRKMLKSAVPGHPISPYYLAPTIVPFEIGTYCRDLFTVLHAGALLTFPLLWEEEEVGARIEGALIIADTCPLKYYGYTSCEKQSIWGADFV